MIATLMAAPKRWPTALGAEPFEQPRGSGELAIPAIRGVGGEFFQFYSTNYGDGFFFEAVERRGDYRGYGAANAPFRIAAQKRALPPKGMPRL